MPQVTLGAIGDEQAGHRLRNALAAIVAVFGEYLHGVLTRVQARATMWSYWSDQYSRLGRPGGAVWLVRIPL